VKDDYLEGKAIPEISRLVIEIDSAGVVKANGDLAAFEAMSKKVGKSTDDTAKTFGAFQLIVNKLPGPLKSVASGLLGIVSPATAVVGVFMETTDAVVKFVQESINAFSRFEKIRVDLEVITGSAKRAKNVFDDLRSIAARSPLNVGELGEAAVILNQSGVAAYDLAENLRFLGDASLGSSEKFNRLTQTFAVIQATGKATAMQIRSLAMAGVPIYKMLEEMGVQGTASADDVSEAFRRMTREGGMFFNAMEKGATTITGLRSTLAGLKDEHKALLAENMSDFVKSYSQAQVDIYAAENEIIRANIELKEISERRKNGQSSWLDDYREAELILSRINAAQENVKKQSEYAGETNIIKMIIGMLPGQLNAMRDIISDITGEGRRARETLNTYQSLVDAHREMVKQQDEYNKLLEESETGYRKMQVDLEEAWANTQEGQIKSIEDQIKKWQEELSRLRYVDEYRYNGSDLSVVGQKQVGITDEEKNKIEDVIRMLTNSRSKVKQELTEWQKIFKSAMNLSDTDTNKDWFRRQSSSISEFVKMLSTANDRAKILSDTLGNDMTNSLENAATAWEQIAENMIMSGEWQADTELFLDVVERAREARDALNEANLDNYISDLNTELSYLRMTTAEMEKQKLIAEFKLNNEEKINDALRIQGSLRREQERLNVLSSATGLSSDRISGLAGRDLYRMIDTSMSARSSDSEFFSGMGIADYAQDIKNIADEWEKIYKTIVSATTIKDGVLIQLFDPALEENAELIERVLNKMNEAKDEYGKAYLADLIKQYEDAGKSTYDLALKRLMIEQNISEEAAIQALKTQEQIDYITNGYDIKGEIMTSIDDALRSIRSGKGGYGQYAGGKFAEAGMNSMQGTDVGNFIEGMAKSGSWEVGLIDMLVNSLAKVLGGMEGLEIILNPITSLLEGLEPLIKSLMLPLLIVGKGFEWLGEGLNWLLSFVFCDLAKLYDTLASTNDKRKEEEERLKALNEQYKNLYAALKEQEEYYLQQRRHLNAEFAIENFQQSRSVNDMILSPSGVFRTDPKDYIIATKHPETLMSGGAAPVYITVENHGSEVSTQESTDADGTRRIRVIVNGIVQQGMVDGSYDGAFDAMAARRGGRRITT